MDKARIEPELIVQYHMRLYGLQQREQIGVTPIVLVTWWRDTAEELAAAIGAQSAPYWLYSDLQAFYTTASQKGQICVVQMPIGAAGTILIMEEMIACGGRIFLGLGMAGGLQPAYPLGSLLIASEGLSQEGTTRHYLPEAEKLSADPRLIALLQECAAEAGYATAVGKQWTTDAPFREMLSQIGAYQAQGVLGVDMETSAMYALGRFRGVQCCNLLVVSDEMWQEWNPGFGLPVLKAGMQAGGKIVVAAAQKLAQELLAQPD